jgi:hypothetical protein
MKNNFNSNTMDYALVTEAIIDDNNHEISEDDRAEEIAARKQMKKKMKRVNECGRAFDAHYDPESGGKKRKFKLCGVPEFCPRCAERIGSQIKERIERAINEGPVAMQHFNDLEASLTVTDGMKGAKDYYREKLDDGSVILYYKCEISDPNKIESAMDLHAVDFTSMVANRMDRKNGRSSGGLGKTQNSPVSSKKEKKDEDETTVEVTHTIINAPGKEIDDAMDRAIAATMHLNPNDKKSLITALAIRTNAFHKELKKDGIVISYTEKKHHRVKLSRIDWLIDKSLIVHKSKIDREWRKVFAQSVEMPVTV